jgi:hypothetical protein
MDQALLDAAQRSSILNESELHSSGHDGYNIRKSPFYQKMVEKHKAKSENPMRHIMQEIARHGSIQAKGTNEEKKQ